MSKAVYKVPGGKLVKVELQQENGSIRKVTVTGDFFVHPEDALVELENALIGCQVEEKAISQKLEQRIAQLRCQLVGFTAQDVAKAIAMAAESEN